jgi:hypothetical protein
LPKRLLGVRKLDWKKKTLEVFEVPRSTLIDKGNSKETDIEKLSIPDLVGNQCCSVILKKDCMMVERNFFGLTTRSIKRMTFELDIKMVLPSIFSSTGKSRLEVAA